MKALVYLLLFFLCLPSISNSQDTLPPIVVTSTRLRDVEEPTSRVPGKVIVITAEDIETQGAKTVQEVLQYQTGIILFDSIGNEFQQTIDLRGFNGQPVTATSVFVDGVRVNEPDFNTINFDLIPIEDIERIEIMPGTATVFGRNALGGVINITTKRGRKNKTHVRFDIGGGTFGRQKYSLAADGPIPSLKNFDYYFGVSRELTQGFREDSGGRLTKILGKLGYRSGNSTDIVLSYTHVQDHLKQAGALPASRLRTDRDDNFTPGDYYDADLHQVALNLRQKLPANWSLALNGFFRGNDLATFVNFSPDPLVQSDSDLRTDIRSGGGILQLTHDGMVLGKKNTLTGGIEYNRNLFTIKNSGAFFGFPFLTKQATKENVVGIYLSDSFNVAESVVLHAGLRYDWNRIEFSDKIDPSLNGAKRFARLNPKVGIIYTPTKGLSLSFSYSQGIRTPTVSEIFAQGPFGSNPDLKPMKSQNFELGAKAQIAPWLEGNLALFYTPVRDEILFTVTDPLTFAGRNNNISRTLRRGLEAALKGRWNKMFDGFVNYSLTKATFETDVLLFSGQVKKGDELPLVPRHHVSAGVNWHPLERLTVSLLANYVGSQVLNNDEPNDAKKLAGYFVLNSRLAYQWRNWTVHLTVNNLTDRKYSTYGILGAEPNRVPAPGINGFGGITFKY